MCFAYIYHCNLYDVYEYMYINIATTVLVRQARVTRCAWVKLTRDSYECAKQNKHGLLLNTSTVCGASPPHMLTPLHQSKMPIVTRLMQATTLLWRA